MQTTKLTAAVVAALMGLTTVAAVAQPQPPRAPDRHVQGHPGPAPKPPVAAPHHPGKPHGMPPGHFKRMGAGPDHKWVKGSRVPPQYRQRHYVVNDWQRHGLKRPPKGHQWVQYGGDYMLVAAATGIITQLILGH